MTDWQPIKISPTATQVLIYDPHEGVVIASNDDGEWRTYEDLEPKLAPTHWMPLPDAPEVDDGQS